MPVDAVLRACGGVRKRSRGGQWAAALLTRVLCAQSLDFPKAGADSRAPLCAWVALRCT